MLRSLVDSLVGRRPNQRDKLILLRPLIVWHSQSRLPVLVLMWRLQSRQQADDQASHSQSYVDPMAPWQFPFLLVKIPPGQNRQSRGFSRKPQSDEKMPERPLPGCGAAAKMCRVLSVDHLLLWLHKQKPLSFGYNLILSFICCVGNLPLPLFLNSLLLISRPCASHCADCSKIGSGQQLSISNHVQSLIASVA